MKSLLFYDGIKDFKVNGHDFYFLSRKLYTARGSYAFALIDVNGNLTWYINTTK